jgi:hypothetical protein
MEFFQSSFARVGQSSQAAFLGGPRAEQGVEVRSLCLERQKSRRSAELQAPSAEDRGAGARGIGRVCRAVVDRVALIEARPDTDRAQMPPGPGGCLGDPGCGAGGACQSLCQSTGRHQTDQTTRGGRPTSADLRKHTRRIETLRQPSPSQGGDTGSNPVRAAEQAPTPAGGLPHGDRPSC